MRWDYPSISVTYLEPQDRFLKQILAFSSVANLADLSFVHQLSTADFGIGLVCVVGAGVSGLRSAEVLAQEGLKVTILEGRNRIGGRVSCSRCPMKRSRAHMHQIYQSSQQGHLLDLYIFLLFARKSR